LEEDSGDFVEEGALDEKEYVDGYTHSLVDLSCFALGEGFDESSHRNRRNVRKMSRAIAKKLSKSCSIQESPNIRELDFWGSAVEGVCDG